MKFYGIFVVFGGPLLFFCSIQTSDKHSSFVKKFFNAVEEQSIPVIKKMLKVKKIAVDSKDDHGRTALQRASCNADNKIFDYLLYRGALFSARDNQGFTIIHYAVLSGDALWVAFLCQRYPAYKDISGYNGITPLMLAACRGYKDIVKTLIALEADIHLCDQFHTSVCMHAASAGILYCISELHNQARFEVVLKNNDNLSALVIAEIFEHYDDAHFLLSCGYKRSLTAVIVGDIVKKMGLECYKKLLLRSAEYYNPDLFEPVYVVCKNVDEIGALKQIYNLTLQECSQEFRDQVACKITQAIMEADEETVQRFLVFDRTSALYFKDFTQFNNNRLQASDEKKRSFENILAWLVYAGNERVLYKKYSCLDEIKEWNTEDAWIRFVAKAARGYFLCEAEVLKLLENSERDLIFKKFFGILLSFGNPMYKQLCYYYQYVHDKRELLHSLFKTEYTLWKMSSAYNRFFLQKLALFRSIAQGEKCSKYYDVKVHTFDK